MPNNIILIAEDDPDDRLLTYEASCEIDRMNYSPGTFRAENHFSECLRYVEDGEELLDYLYHRGKYRKDQPDQDPAPRPSIILLDLNMPKVNGREVLKRLKDDPELHMIPIIVMTTSRAEEDLLRSYYLGANSFISKPTTFGELVAVMKGLKVYWFETVKLPAWVEKSNLKHSQCELG